VVKICQIIQINLNHSNLGHNTISMLYDMYDIMSYCGKLTGENLSDHSNKTESVSLRKANR